MRIDTYLALKSTCVNGYLPLLLHGTDGCGEVTTLTVFHDDVELGTATVNDAVVIHHYMFVLQLTQKIHL